MVWFGTQSGHVRESFGGGSWIGRSVPEGRGTLGGWAECSMVCIARFPNEGRMGSGGKGGGIFGPGSPGWEDIPGAWRPISAPFTPPLCPFFAASLKIYLAMLQRVMPPGEKYFACPLGSEGILSLSLHHSAREGRPQGH